MVIPKEHKKLTPAMAPASLKVRRVQMLIGRKARNKRTSSSSHNGTIYIYIYTPGIPPELTIQKDQMTDGEIESFTSEEQPEKAPQC